MIHTPSTLFQYCSVEEEILKAELEQIRKCEQWLVWPFYS